MVTVGWSAAGLIHYSFLIPAKPLHLRSMLSKRRDAPETAAPVAGIGHQNGPNSSLQQRLTTHPTTNASKVE